MLILWTTFLESAKALVSFQDQVVMPVLLDESLFEQPEPPTHSNTAMEKIFWRRNLLMHDQQHNWQESPEGRKMLEFRNSLPAYMENDAMLSAISQNQVVITSGETGCGKTTQILQ